MTFLDAFAFKGTYKLWPYRKSDKVSHNIVRVHLLRFSNGIDVQTLEEASMGKCSGQLQFFK